MPPLTSTHGPLLLKLLARERNSDNLRCRPGPSQIAGRRLSQPLHIVIVLAWVRRLVVEPLEQTIDSKGQSRARERTDPVNPVVAGKRGEEGRAKCSGRIQRGAREADAGQVSEKDGGADADGGEKRRSMLLNGQEVNGENELGGKERLQQDALQDAGLGAQFVCDEQRAGQETGHHARRRNSRRQLGRDDGEGPEGRDGADEDEAQRDLGESAKEWSVFRVCI